MAEGGKGSYGYKHDAQGCDNTDPVDKRAEPYGSVPHEGCRVGKDELCAVDSTSISSYGFNLVDIRWGRNKEHLPPRQTVEVVVYSITSHMPIFYLELPGNMPDSRTVELIMKELEHAGFRNLILITDRGYEFSEKSRVVYLEKTEGDNQRQGRPG